MTHTAHGGDIRSYVERFGREPVDFSASTNPLGLSPGARAAIIDALDVADRYPDPLCRGLRDALAAHEHVGPQHIVCGNGASDVLWRTVGALAPTRALVLAPTFSEYEEALSSCGCSVDFHVLHEANGYRADDRLVADVEDRLEKGLDLAVLCEPNNPTGVADPRAVIEAVIERCSQRGATVIVDECFNGFLDDPASVSVADMVERFENLVVVKAHTKIYGMAGIRLGYALFGSKDVARLVAEAGPTWPVSMLAQAAGIAALSDSAYLARARTIIAEERPRIAAALEAAGCAVYPSHANYLLCKAPDSLFGERLAEQGVLVRACGNYRGLTDRHFRIAVKAPHENDILINALQREDALHALSPAQGERGLKNPSPDSDAADRSPRSESSSHQVSDFPHQSIGKDVLA